MSVVSVFSTELTGESVGWQNFTLRQIISVDQIVGETLRLAFTLSAPESAGIQVAKMFVHRAVGNSLQTVSPGVPILFGGQAAVSIPANTSRQSDFVEFSAGDATSILISIFTNGPTNYRTGPRTGCDTFYKEGDFANDTNGGSWLAVSGANRSVVSDISTINEDGMHRHWSIHQYRAGEGNGGFSGITELELRTSPGGLDITTGATASIFGASIQAGAAANMIDNNNSTRVQVNGNAGGIQYRVDLGAGNEAEVVEVAIMPNLDAISRTPVFFEVRSSDDNWMTFNTEWVGYNISYTLSAFTVFTRPTALNSRYWMMRALTVPSVTMGVVELEFHETVGGVDNTAGLNAFSMTEFPGGYDAGKAFDDNTGTLYSGSSGVAGSEFLAIDYGMGVTKDVAEIVLRPRDGGNESQAPTVGSMLSSPDGRSFLPRWRFSKALWSPATSQTFRAATGDLHRFWRLLIVANSSNVASISRLEFRQMVGGEDTAFANTLTTTGSWNSAANLFDGNNASFAFTNGVAARNATFSVGIDYGQESNWRDIVEVSIRNRQDDAGVQGPTNMVVQYSDDGVVFTNAWQMVDIDWTALATVRNYAKQNYPNNRLVLDIVAPPIDSGPNALALTAAGNATVADGRFVFDGTGDYYSNTGLPTSLKQLPWTASFEIDALLTTFSNFNGVLCLGDSVSRILLTEENGDFYLYEDSTIRLFVGGVLSPTTPVNLRLEVNGTVTTLIINGIVIGSGTLTSSKVYSALYLGSDPASLSARSMQGGFSGVRIRHALNENDLVVTPVTKRRSLIIVT